MTTDRALEILEMSEQARWKDGIESEDVNKAVETIRKELEEVEKYKKAIEEFNTRIDYECGSKGHDDYDYCSGLIRAKRILEVRLRG